MNWLEEKYLSLLSGRLRNFKRKSSNLYNFSCPFCGDSSTDKRKARGYVYRESQDSKFYCHNCHKTMKLKRFIKEVDESLYRDMLKEQFLDNKPSKIVLEEEKPKQYKSNEHLDKTKNVMELLSTHRARKLLYDRKIPKKHYAKMFYVDNFFAWVNDIIPKKFSDEALLHDEGRLIIPCFDKKGTFHALTARSFQKDSKAKYISIIFDETVPKIYGLDRLDQNKTFYVVEGAIDSLFIDNCIAVTGGDLASQLNTMDEIETIRKNAVLIFDNEPRNKDVIARMKKAMQQGYKVVIWPDNVKYKDINEMIMNGMIIEDIMNIIDSNVYSEPFHFNVRITKWSKVK